MSIAATCAFFGPRATGWEDRFPDDDPLFEAAIRLLCPPAGGTVLDAGCGTGRAGLRCAGPLERRGA